MKTLAEQVKEYMDWRSSQSEESFSSSDMASDVASHQAGMPKEKRCKRQNIESIFSRDLRTTQYLVALAKAMGTTAEVLQSGQFIAGGGLPAIADSTQIPLTDPNLDSDQEKEPTPLAAKIAQLYDMIPEADQIRRTKAFNAATEAIISVIESTGSSVQTPQDQKKQAV